MDLTRQSRQSGTVPSLMHDEAAEEPQGFGGAYLLVAYAVALVLAALWVAWSVADFGS